ncbi:MAG TPA: hypothetical protein VNP92_34400 [Actinophytocola sp.]|nr:hypothetical protein [Actinophytocola sp.]
MSTGSGWAPPVPGPRRWASTPDLGEGGRSGPAPRLTAGAVLAGQDVTVPLF